MGTTILVSAGVTALDGACMGDCPARSPGEKQVAGVNVIVPFIRPLTLLSTKG